MAEGKWVQDLRPDMPLTEAAQDVLRARLEVVQDHLPKAVTESERDPEHVHQLRVATRRADAAMRIFRTCLPGRVYRQARGRLRTARRAAGAARDWDVFLIALRDRATEVEKDDLPGVDFLIAYALGQRAAAQAALTALEAGEDGGTFPGFIVATVEEVRPPHHDARATLADLARPMIHTLLLQLRQAAGGDLKDYDHLHQVRIQGKRLRYAMEVLHCCFAPAFRDTFYPMIEEMQELLGRANDSHVAIGRLTGLRDRLRDWPRTWERVKGGIEGLLRFHQRRLPQERRRFLKWWEQWQQGGIEAVTE